MIKRARRRAFDEEGEVIKLRLALFYFLFLTGAAAVRAQDVAVDFDRASDFSKYKTYSWADGIPAKNPLIDQHIRASVEEQLAAKGLRRVESGGDMSVLYFAAVENDLHVATAGWRTTGDWLSQTESGISVRSQMWDVESGRLIVCLSDAASKNLLWRGNAKTSLDKKSHNRNIVEAMQEDARKVDKRIRKSVAKMFKQYPAARSGA
jgi:Domain of unknown function (DUF4136)